MGSGPEIVMLASMARPTPEQLRVLLDYAPLTGILTWRVRSIRPGFERIDKMLNTRCAGKCTGTKSLHNGAIYLKMTIFRVTYFVHRIVWTHYHGAWPTLQIDHINGDSLDNRIANLRLATQQQNSQNMKALRSNNTSGIKGVSWCKLTEKWAAQIADIDLGRYASKAEAIAVRQRAAKELFGEFANETPVTGSAPEVERAS